MDTEVLGIPAEAKLTDHAAKRYAQRILGIPRLTAQDYRRAKIVLKRMARESFFVLVAETGSESFWSTAEGTVLCVHDGAIVTVYPKDFIVNHRWQDPESLEILLALVA
jgi:hypothetical protein